MDDHLNHRRMQLVTVTYRRRTTFDIADVTPLIRHQNRAFKLSGFFCIDTEIGRQFHWATHTLRHINKRAVRCHRRIQRGKEIVIPRDDGTEVFFYQFWMIVDGLAERAENNTLFRQLIAVGRRD